MARGEAAVRYNRESGRIVTTVYELISIARRGISPTVTYDEDEPSIREASARMLRRIVGEGEARSITYGFDDGAYGFEFTASIDRAEKNALTVAREVGTSTGKPTREDDKQIRGEAFVLGYALAKIEGYDSVLLKIVYINPINGSYTVTEEELKIQKLETFFRRCLKAISVYARPEIERVTERLPTMKGMKFPYKNLREGQSEFVRAAYRALARGGILYASAPTGTGKTVSALYPAMRAMGDGRFDKIFYLTPKTTTSEAVKECLSIMVERGVSVRASVLTAKEKCCISGHVCRDSRKKCPLSACNKIADAALALYDRAITVVTREEVVKCAREYAVCPYELSLAYSELCDIVVADFNHLFDPVVYIRRFFTERGSYAFLIDEAHNLVDRGREIWSAEITSADISEPERVEILGVYSATKQLCGRACRVFESVLHPLIKDELRESKDGELVGAVNISEMPTRMYELFDELLTTVDAEAKSNIMAKDEESEARLKYLRSYYYKVKKLSDALSRFDDHFKAFVFFEGGAYRMKLYCLDPSPLIRERLMKGHGALLFSATLSPIEYYRSILGGERSDEMLEVASPFDPSQLSVTIMDKVSTRYSEREDTLGAVSKVIAATVSAKRGNYMIFTPSFAYAEALEKQFKARYPKVRTLLQRRDMTREEKAEFLAKLKAQDGAYLVAFCVMGGIYAEGIDLAGDSLIGAVIVGIGIPQLSYEREALTEYYEEKYEMGKQYAYIYPGMNRVFQAAGRVIRREDDRGVIVLIDDRFDDPIYKKSLPSLWSGVRFIGDPKRLREILDEFWKGVEEEKKRRQKEDCED